MTKKQMAEEMLHNLQRKKKHEANYVPEKTHLNMWSLQYSIYSIGLILFTSKWI